MTETVKSAQDESGKDSSNPSPSSKSSKVSKQANDANERSKQADKTEKPPTKIVVRRLPPTMTLETFVEQVSPLPPVDFMYFVKADSTLSPHSFCRAYLHFVHVDDMLIFTEKFDNYVFVDGKGNEFPAIVEYAPFQRIPKQRSTRKKDPRVGTIENDPYFQEFIDALKAEEAQRKSASKTNKQHFFETSATPSVQKITSTPLLEFLKTRRADKLRSKEDRIAERRKREVERRKAREDVRGTTKQMHGDGDAPALPAPQIKIAGHVVTPDKSQKDSTESKKTVKVATPPSRQERKDREKDPRKDILKDSKKDTRDKDIKPEPESSSLKDSENNVEKHKENIASFTETRSKDIRKAGKSYQEERQRLNERRQAAKASNSKASSNDDGSHSNEREDNILVEESSGKKMFPNKDGNASFDLRNRSSDKSKGSENTRNQSSRDSKRPEKFKLDQRKNFDTRKNVDSHGDRKELKKGQDDRQADISKSSAEGSQSKDQGFKNPPLKEEVRKKSYNQEREQRRAAEKKVSSKKEFTQTSKNEDLKVLESKECSSLKSDMSIESKSQNLKGSPEANETDQCKGGGDGLDTTNRSSFDGSNLMPQGQDLTSNSKSLSDARTFRTSSEDGDVYSEKTAVKSKNDEKDKRDPRAERRIRNKDRPSIEIYRPGMGRFSRQRMEREKGLSKGSSTERDSPSSSPSPIPIAVKGSVPEK